MADDLRTCRKTACRWPAAASLSYRYDTRQVWLTDLSGEPDPSLYDLCPHHADDLTVPRGWDRVDQRTEPLVVQEPAGRDLAQDAAAVCSDQLVAAASRMAARRRPAEPSAAGSRYAALAEDLPRLAAEWGSAGEDLDLTDPPPTEPPTRDTAPVRVVPSRDLAPMPAGEDAVPAPPDGEAADTQPQVDGQLRMAVEGDAGDGVVVSIELAGRRREP